MDHPDDRDPAKPAPARADVKGVVHDGHGEFQLDPESGDAEQQRRDADAVEDHEERSADETRGAVTKERPE